MSEIDDEILNDIYRLKIDCPACKYQTDDEQYTCDTCWCVGGNGTINVFKWLKEHQNVFK